MNWSILFLSLFFQPDTSLVVDTSALKELKSLRLENGFFTTDNLGNCYVVKKDQVTKYNANGDSICTQSFKWLGTISSTDASNSLRIILFYRDLNQLVVLDNTLSMQGEPVKLEKLGWPFATLVCQSPNNNTIWLYETEEFRLLRLDRNFQVINNSGNLTQVIGRNMNPNFIVENENLLYLNNPEQGILVFDMYGTYSKTIPIKELDYFQVIGKDIFYLKNGKLMKYSQLDFNTIEINLPGNALRQVRIEKQRLFLQDSLHLRIYSLGN